MKIKTLTDLENRIRSVETEGNFMQASLEENLRDITGRINLKSIVGQIVTEAKEDPGFVKNAAMAAAVLLINHFPKKLGGKGGKFSILSTLLSLAPTSQIASAGEKASQQLLNWLHKVREKRNKKTEATITDSY